MRSHLVDSRTQTHEIRERAQLYDSSTEAIDGALGRTNSDLEEYSDALNGRMPLATHVGANGEAHSRVTLGEMPDENGRFSSDFFVIDTLPDENILVMKVDVDTHGFAVVRPIALDRNGHAMRVAILSDTLNTTEDAYETVKAVIEKFKTEYGWRDRNCSPSE